MFGEERLTAALVLLGDILAERGLRFDVVVVGGGALLLLGLSVRPTQDLDVIAESGGDRLAQLTVLPEALEVARNDVARTLGLPDSWLNCGPSALLDLGLPVGFAERVEIRKFGPLRSGSPAASTRSHSRAANERP